MSKFVYMDHSATTALSKEVLSSMMPYLTENYGNPSSIYSIGRKNRAAIEEARKTVADCLKCSEKEVFFTASGTESDNWAIRGVAKALSIKGKHIITSAIEHPAILETCKDMEKQGYEVTYLPVDKDGLISLEDLKSAIRKDTVIVSIMTANNEIGTIQPVSEIGQICKQAGVYFHTDSVQAIGNMHIDVNKMNVDLMSVSGHKFYGPKGVGVLYIRKGTKIKPFVTGGHQESGKRAATENVAGIVGLATAMKIATDNIDINGEKLRELRDYMISRIENEIPYVRLNGHRTNRMPGHVNFSFQYIEGEALLLMLDANGIAGSSGSACTSGSLDPSHVLLAIGLPHEIAHGSLRLSMGTENTKEDVDYVVDKLKIIVQRLRDMSPLYDAINK